MKSEAMSDSLTDIIIAQKFRRSEPNRHCSAKINVYNREPTIFDRINKLKQKQYSQQILISENTESTYTR